MTTADDVLRIALAEVGGGSPNPNKWQRFMGIGNQAWCAAFVSWCFHEAGLANAPRSAWCDDFVRNYKSGAWGTWISQWGEIAPGDQVIYDWDGGYTDHTALVLQVKENGNFTTVEGNWGNRVVILNRDRSNIVGFGRPRYDTAKPNTPSAPGTPSVAGKSVLDLQRALNIVLRDRRIAEDGEMGPETTLRVREFQQFANTMSKIAGSKDMLEVDGVAGPLTWSKLSWWVNAASHASRTKPVVPAGWPLLQKGSNSERVRQLQNCLNVLNRAGLAVDGQFGPATESALKLFQATSKLDADGVYGPQTAAAMSSRVASL